MTLDERFSGQIPFRSVGLLRVVWHFFCVFFFFNVLPPTQEVVEDKTGCDSGQSVCHILPEDARKTAEAFLQDPECTFNNVSGPDMGVIIRPFGAGLRIQKWGQQIWLAAITVVAQKPSRANQFVGHNRADLTIVENPGVMNRPRPSCHNIQEPKVSITYSLNVDAVITLPVPENLPIVHPGG